MMDTFLTIISIFLLILVVLCVIVFVCAAIYMSDKDKGLYDKPTLSFDGPSICDMQQTTARLLKEDKVRKYRRPYFQK